MYFVYHKREKGHPNPNSRFVRALVEGQQRKRGGRRKEAGVKGGGREGGRGKWDRSAAALPFTRRAAQQRFRRMRAKHHRRRHTQTSGAAGLCDAPVGMSKSGQATLFSDVFRSQRFYLLLLICYVVAFASSVALAALQSPQPHQ